MALSLAEANLLLGDSRRKEYDVTINTSTFHCSRFPVGVMQELLGNQWEERVRTLRVAVADDNDHVYIETKDLTVMVARQRNRALNKARDLRERLHDGFYQAKAEDSNRPPSAAALLKQIHRLPDTPQTLANAQTKKAILRKMIFGDFFDGSLSVPASKITEAGGRIGWFNQGFASGCHSHDETITFDLGKLCRLAVRCGVTEEMRPDDPSKPSPRRLR